MSSKSRHQSSSKIIFHYLPLPWIIFFQKNMDDAQAHLHPWNIDVGCVMNLRQNFITQEISSHPFYRETGQTWERKCRSSFVPFCMGDNARISTLLKISPWVIHQPCRGGKSPARSMTFLRQFKAHAGIKTKRGWYWGGQKKKKRGAVLKKFPFGRKETSASYRGL
jgi:hypothetical protein